MFFKNRIGILILSLVFLIYIPKPAFAQESINSFEATLTAQKSGIMVLDEKIVYDFGDLQRHGIFRFIPLVSKVGDLYRVIKIDFQKVLRNGKPEEFTTDYTPKSAEVKIGDPDKIITHEHTYNILYTVENGIGSNYEDHDEIYWNVTGNEWNVPINSASIIIKTDFGLMPENTICFTGSPGSKEQNCKVEETEGGKKITTTLPILPNEGLTIVSSFPVGTFPKSELLKTEPIIDPDFLAFLNIYKYVWVGLNLILAPYLMLWYFKNKSKTRLGPPKVNFDFPKDPKGKAVAPAEAGIIDNTILERNDIVATIFDLAIKKFIKIEEVKTVKNLAPDQTDFKFIKLKEYNGENAFESKLMDDLFKGSSKEVLMNDLKTDFYKTFQKLEKEVFGSLVERGYYTRNPKTQKALLLFLSVFILFGANLILSSVLFFLSRKLNGRTAVGDKMDWQIDGLKIFLKNMSRHHAFQAKNLITVEKYIPYAIAFGLHNEFMGQLKVIYPDYNPAWYSGTHGFYRAYPGMYSSFSSNVTTSAPSQSSGFSGGGSSGGGGGGGGGGSW